MRRFALGMALISIASAAGAEAASVSFGALARDPKAFVGRTIRLSAARCAVEPRGMFACIAEQDGLLLRVESLGLDHQTTAEIRRKLSASCRGRADSAPEACTFDAEFKPVNIRTATPRVKSSRKMLNITTRRMNLFAVAGEAEPSPKLP
jgi:hypothetical protein